MLTVSVGIDDRLEDKDSFIPVKLLAVILDYYKITWGQHPAQSYHNSFLSNFKTASFFSSQQLCFCIFSAVVMCQTDWTVQSRAKLNPKLKVDNVHMVTVDTEMI